MIKVLLFVLLCCCLEEQTSRISKYIHSSFHELPYHKCSRNVSGIREKKDKETEVLRVCVEDRGKYLFPSLFSPSPFYLLPISIFSNLVNKTNHKEPAQKRPRNSHAGPNDKGKGLCEFAGRRHQLHDAAEDAHCVNAHTLQH
jgi:hypothetical protein